MPTQLIAVGTGAANSADIVVTDPVTISLKDAAGPDVPADARVEIFIKDDAGQYFKLWSLSGAPNCLAVTITGPGTYRASRTDTSASCGVFRS